MARLLRLLALGCVTVALAAPLAWAQDKLSDADVEAAARRVARRIALKLSEGQRSPALYEKQLEDLAELLTQAASPKGEVACQVRLLKARTHFEVGQRAAGLAELDAVLSAVERGPTVEKAMEMKARQLIEARDIGGLDALAELGRERGLADDFIVVLIGSRFLLQAREASRRGDKAAIEAIVVEAEAARVSFEVCQLIRREIARCSLARGEKAPAFKARDTAGAEVSLAAARGKTLLVVFWASWCEPCHARMPAIEALRKRYAEAGFEVLGVNLDEERPVMSGFCKRYAIGWRQINDGEVWKTPVARLYLVDALPSNVLVGPEGEIIDRDLSPEELASILEARLSDGS